MTFLADLSPGEAPYTGPVLNVGWLSSRRAFPTGSVPDAFTPALARLREVPSAMTRGLRLCEFCPRDGEDEPGRFDAGSPFWSRPEYGNDEIARTRAAT